MWNIIYCLLPIAAINFGKAIAETESCSDFIESGHSTIKYTCNPRAINITISFKQSFVGTVYAKGFYADPKCSSPNMNVRATKEVTLTLSLLKCGTKVKRQARGNRRIRNTIVIQHNPLIRSLNDSEINITCSPCEPLPTGFWDQYQFRDHKNKPSLEMNMEFRSGSDLFSQKGASWLGVLNKLFLVLHVKDTGEFSDFYIRKCLAHNESIIGENTSVILVSETKICTGDLIEQLSLDYNSSIPYIPGFTEVNNFNIATKEGLYITCALQLCQDICPSSCLEEFRVRQTNPWSSVVGTHKVIKRSSGESNSNLNSNENLKSRVRTLAAKFQKLKSQLDAEKSSDQMKNSGRVAFQSFTVSPNYDEETEVILDSSTDTVNSKTEFSKRDIRSQEDFNSFTNNTLKESFLTETSVRSIRRRVLPENCSEISCFSNATITKIQEIAPSQNISVGTTLNFTTSSADLEQFNNTSNVSNTTVDFLDPLISNVTKSVCVPRLKFVTVTATLSILSFCIFLICIGVLLHARKEQKRQSLDTYMLYSFF